MKVILIVTTVIEVGAGLALSCCPTAAAAMLLGSAVDQTLITVAIERVAGAALLALGAANWLAHYDEKSFAARGVVSSMVIYNLGTVFILADAGIRIQKVGIALWPAVFLHTVMAGWCIFSLLKKPWRNKDI